MIDLVKEINRLKKEKKAVILAHNYQVEDVQLVADYLGDSLELSKIAAETDADTIVFAGVKFMAETAKLLSPEKKVLLPRLDAGCPMADMITVDELRELKAAHPDAKVVTYVNSSVETKAESDVCCTSANALSVVKNIDSDKIIFVPDKNLGSYVASKVPEKEVVLFEGYCYVHNRILRKHVEESKALYPHARVLIHPEAPSDTLELADEICSTSGMLRAAREDEAKQFIIVTEQGLIERMRRENPGKEFYSAGSPKVCINMKRTSLHDLYAALNEDKYIIEVEAETADAAKKSLEKMLLYV